MSTTITVIVEPTKNELAAYNITIGEGSLERIQAFCSPDGKSLLEDVSSIAIVYDSNVEEYSKKVASSLPALRSCQPISVPCGEENKSIDSLQKLWLSFSDRKLDRRSLIVAIGGGVLLDLVGFASSTYMRGLRTLYIPTTLLSQVDASIGGKTGCNFSGIKNLIGTFSQPVGVLIDPEVLKSLPPREISAGLAEMIKHGLIASRAHFEELGTTFDPMTFSTLGKLISDSIRIKSMIVASDPFERGERKLLNFGHTIGHALEGYFLHSDTPLLHGEAVALGMIAESRISMAVSGLREEEYVSIVKAIENARLPTKTPHPVNLEELNRYLVQDKKNVSGAINYSLLSAIGNGVFNQNAPRDIVSDAVKAISI